MTRGICPECDQLFYGRRDKKFCDDYCRNSYNNKLNSDSSNYIRNVNNTLRRNRRILESLFDKKIERASWQTLAQLGFNFSYCTHIKPADDGKIYSYCYDYGYLLYESEFHLIKNENIG